MAYIDNIYHNILEEINSSGYVYNDTKRGITCKQIDSSLISYQMDFGFPAITTKKLFFKSIVVELLWFLRGDQNIKYLIDNGCNIWNKDAYNWYLKDAEKSQYLPMDFPSFISNIKNGNLTTNQNTNYILGDVGRNYGVQWRKFNFSVDQIEVVLENIISNPYNRRNIVTAWNPNELDETALPPCHWAFELIVSPNNQGQNFHNLSLKWHQRSVDTFLGLPFNIASYAILLEIFCELLLLKSNYLYGDLSNVHIYANHIEAVYTQLSRNTNTHTSPILVLSDNLKSQARKYREREINLSHFLNSLEYTDFELVDYQSEESIFAEMIAPKNI